MGQMLPNRQSGERDAWLGALVESFEQVETQAAIPCDAALIAAMHNRLMHPSQPIIATGLDHHFHFQA